MTGLHQTVHSYSLSNDVHDVLPAVCIKFNNIVETGLVYKEYDDVIYTQI